MKTAPTGNPQGVKMHAMIIAEVDSAQTSGMMLGIGA